MECIRGVSTLLNNTGKQKEISFLENGSMLLEGLISSCNGKCNPIRSFSVNELIIATKNFDPQLVIMTDDHYKLYKGYLGGHQVSIKKYDTAIQHWSLDSLETLKLFAIRDIVITSQMSSHKNVLKLLGCCLELQASALVYEYAGDELLSNCLFDKEGCVGHDARVLSWKNRLRISNEIANALVYLHTALSTSVVHRGLMPLNVIIDQHGVAKLCDFSSSISIPAGERRVEVKVTGTLGFVDPEYLVSGFVTCKSDAYSFGILLLMLLTGQRAVSFKRGDDAHIVTYVNNYIRRDQFNKIVDPRILDDEGGIEREQQLQAFLALALRCVQAEEENRPEMIDVAKELRRIEKFVCPC